MAERFIVKDHRAIENVGYGGHKEGDVVTIEDSEPWTGELMDTVLVKIEKCEPTVNGTRYHYKSADGSCSGFSYGDDFNPSF